jgi:hypothetical protein
VAAVATITSVMLCCAMAICVWRARKRHEVRSSRAHCCLRRRADGPDADGVQLQTHLLKRRTANIIATGPRIDMQGARGATAISDVRAPAARR